MSYLEIILLAFGLCADTLAVTMAFGAAGGKIGLGGHLKIDLTLGLIQAALTALGWLLGDACLSLIESVDHWIAFGLLLFIGAKMIVEALRPSEEVHSDLMHFGPLILAGIATSIDALAVGISLAMMALPAIKLTVTFAAVFAVTALVAATGLIGGRAFEKVLGRSAGIVAGIILIAIGVKILLEHLVF
ncbi:MAG: manganese efflux pump [Bacteroidales bacterium]|nr:manganese efflux pump [Bacteroidales bacterium]